MAVPIKTGLRECTAAIRLLPISVIGSTRLFGGRRSGFESHFRLHSDVGRWIPTVTLNHRCPQVRFLSSERMSFKDREQQRQYQRDWIARRRRDFFEGKSCASCGSTDDLELDHIDPRTKKFQPSRLWSMSESNPNRVEELAKCQVLCSDCHKRKTSLEVMTEHGTRGRYKRGCRCRPCTDVAVSYSDMIRRRSEG